MCQCNVLGLVPDRGRVTDHLKADTYFIKEKSGNMPSHSLVWANMPSGVNMPSNMPHIL